MYRCPWCNFDAIRLSILREHIQRCQKIPKPSSQLEPWRCSLCGAQLADLGDLAAHVAEDVRTREAFPDSLEEADDETGVDDNKSREEPPPELVQRWIDSHPAEMERLLAEAAVIEDMANTEEERLSGQPLPQDNSPLPPMPASVPTQDSSYNVPGVSYDIANFPETLHDQLDFLSFAIECGITRQHYEKFRKLRVVRPETPFPARLETLHDRLRRVFESVWDFETIAALPNGDCIPWLPLTSILRYYLANPATASLIRTANEQHTYPFLDHATLTAETNRRRRLLERVRQMDYYGESVNPAQLEDDDQWGDLPPLVFDDDNEDDDGPPCDNVFFGTYKSLQWLQELEQTQPLWRGLWERHQREEIELLFVHVGTFTDAFPIFSRRNDGYSACTMTLFEFPAPTRTNAGAPTITNQSFFSSACKKAFTWNVVTQKIGEEITAIMERPVPLARNTATGNYDCYHCDRHSSVNV
jgi:hypothetical protein